MFTVLLGFYKEEELEDDLLPLMRPYIAARQYNLHELSPAGGVGGVVEILLIPFYPSGLWPSR
jgi:hypothetical protein